MQSRWCPGKWFLSDEITTPAGSLQSRAMIHCMHLQREGYDPTCSAQPRMAFHKLGCGFPPAIVPLCDGAEQRITAAAKGSTRAQLGYCMTWPYKEARPLLMCPLKPTRQRKKAAKLLQSTEDKQQKTANMPCKLPSVPPALQIHFSIPLSALFTTKRSNFHPPLYLDVFTFFICCLPSI